MYLIWLCWVLVATCKIWFPDQGWNPGPLHWKLRVFANEPLRSLNFWTVISLFYWHWVPLHRGNVNLEISLTTVMVWVIDFLLLTFFLHWAPWITSFFNLSPRLQIVFSESPFQVWRLQAFCRDFSFSTSTSQVLRPSPHLLRTWNHPK